MLTPEQAEVLGRIDSKSADLERQFEQIQAQIKALPNVDALKETLSNIQLPKADVLVEQLSEHLLSPLVTPVEQLQEASEIILAIPEKVEEKLEAIEADLDELSETPEAIQEAFEDAQEKANEALDYLTEKVGEDLIPQWDEIKELFESLGKASLDDFEQVLINTMSELDGIVQETVKEAFDRQFGAITQVQDDTENLVDNTTKLAQRIQELCDVLAQSEIVLSEETQKANVGVNKTIEAINEIETALKSKLPI